MNAEGFAGDHALQDTEHQVENAEVRELDAQISDEKRAEDAPAKDPVSADSEGHAPTLAVDEEKVISSGSSSSSERPQLKKLDSRVVDVPKAAKEGDEFAHLPPHERAILERQVRMPEVKVGYTTLFRYATTWDWTVIAVSTICAIIGGAALPLMTLLFGNLAGTFQSYFNGSLSGDDFDGTLVSYVLDFVYLAIGEFVTIYVATLGFIYSGEHLTQKIREHYLAAILRQNVGFFDKLGAGEITTRITADMNLVQEGISEKLGLVLTAVATFLAAFVIGFIKYWKLTLILVSTVVALVLVMGSAGRFMMKYNKQSLSTYARGGSVAEEVISSIRNAIAFGTQDKLARQYETYLIEAERWGIKVQTTMALMMGGMFWVIYLNYGLAFWQGSRFVVDGETSLSSVLTIMLSIMIGAFSLGNVAPNMRSFSSAASAGVKIFSTIDRVSPLDPTSPAGKELDNVQGHIELRHVKHIYPSRPEVVVMRDVSITIPHGKTTALVGASGSGKSTIVGLVERFYDPVGGEIFLDGEDIRNLNLRWLRRHISLVSQEPTLFSTTIEDNIRQGLIGTPEEHSDPEKQRALIVDAAKQANAHDFISTLPEGYNTNVGERGFLLSGGQKQRIAIARAMVSDPKILLLDEATSALDTKSEGVVQAALDKAAQGRTTIVIAHRLSTIKTADNIVVMASGRVVEQGTHSQLLARQGAYYKLVEAQKIAAEQQKIAAATEETPEVNAVEEQLNRTATRQSAAAQGLAADDAQLVEKLEHTTTTQSVSSLALKSQSAGGERTYSLWTLLKLIASFNGPEKWFMINGLVWSIIVGGGNPTQAVFFAKALTALALPASQVAEIQNQSSFWSLMYLMLAFVILIGFLVQGASLGYCSERLVRRVRNRAFRTILRQDVQFFDLDENSAGALTSFLSSQTTSAAGLSGATLGTILVSITTLVAAFVLSTAIGWKLALVCSSMIPVVLACGFFRFWILARFQQRSKRAYEKSAGYACEATSAVRTVASLTRETDVWKTYHDSVTSQVHTSLVSVAKSSTLYAISQSFTFFAMALGFWWGGTLIGRGEYNMFQFFVCFSAIIFGAQSAGIVFSFAPDMGKAKQAAQDLKTLFDRKPTIDTWSHDGKEAEAIEGSIEFRDVHFRYPTRPEQPVLRGLNLTVKPGQYVALVGASGCGKSTTIQLMERFYDPLSGGVYVDGRDVASYNVNSYRQHLALVSQEPTLYQGSVRDNILLGVTTDDMPEDRIVKACKDANIYDFITSLPEGFGTIVGSKGSMLSGGQKQRIAIARALLRDPRILLLDEATSALDSESEQVVQAALDAAAKGRTTIAVAHRLSTIQNADQIYVFDQGRIVEAGTHQELLAMHGKYFELVNLQSLDKGQ